MAGDAIVIGSGAAGSVAAWELARNGWNVTVLERGRNMRPGLGERRSGELGTRYGTDEIKSSTRHFGMPDPLLEPYTQRTQADAAGGTRAAVGAYGQLGAAVGGTTLHYNAKFPRFWKQDFNQLSLLGPVPGAQVADWPISYDDLSRYYDIVERQVGVQGDREAMPARTREQSPRRHQFEMGPNPTPHVGKLLAEGAKRAGFTAYPQPAAVNSRRFKGRPACNSCGLCSGFGCPINARGDALVSWLNPAMRSGNVRLIARAFAYRVETTRNGRRAVGVRYVDRRGRRQRISADVIVLAGSPINTARLLLMSRSAAHPDGLGNRSGQVGRNLMFHNFTLGAAVFTEEVHPERSQSNPYQVDDLVGPFTGLDVKALGVPYVMGGLVQVGGAMPLFTEAALLAGVTGYGLSHKLAMKTGVLHSQIGGSQIVHQDLPQAENRVDLDSDVTDHNGFPAARITYSPHQHEKAASLLLGPRMELFHQLAPGAVASAFIPYPVINSGAQYTAHLAGTARMGEDPRASVCDPSGRLHQLQNVYVADASTFPTFPGFNPTNTIMANALRISRGIAGARRPVGRSRDVAPESSPPPAVVR